MKRIAMLLGALAALLLVPTVAQAAAGVEHMKFEIKGNGSGKIYVNPERPFYRGTPEPDCYWNGGAQAYEEYESGKGLTCESLMSDEGEGWEALIFDAEAAPGSTFVKWLAVENVEIEAGCAGSFPACNVYIEPPGTGGDNGRVEALFCNEGESEAECLTPAGPEGPPLTLNIEEGTGTVVSNPAGIECTGEAPHECSTEEIAEGQVTLTASPAAGYRFKSWKGCDKKNIPVSGDGVNGRQCTITLNEAKSVSAKFVKTWDVTLENGGGGKVSTKPGGALCLPSCSETTASFDEGKNVEVLTKPNKHFHLVEFGGDCSGSSCTLSAISADHTVSASFAEDTKFALDISKEGGGTGLVKTKGPGTVCSYTCSSSTSSFYEGEEVEVSWKLGKGTDSIAFSGEAGDCPASSEAETGSCHVTMGAAHSLTATLE